MKHIHTFEGFLNESYKGKPYFKVTVLPSIGDRVKYNGRSYQLVSDLKDSKTKDTYWADVVHIAKDIYWEKRFYFELIK